MDLRQQIQVFLERHQTTGWLLLLMGAGLLLQGLLYMVLSIAGSSELFGTIVEKFYLPYSLEGLLYQPWSLFTYPFFVKGFPLLGLLMAGLILWAFGRIHQQLLGEQRTRRLVIIGIPTIGLITVIISTFFNFQPVSSASITPAGVDIPVPSQVDAETQPADETITLTEEEAVITVSEGRKIDDTLIWVWGLMPITILLVISAITLVPDYPIQLFLFGQVRIVWVGLILLFLEYALALFFTPAAIAILVAAGLGFLHVYFLKKGTDITERIWSFYQNDDSSPRMKVKYGGAYNGKKEAKPKAKSGNINQEAIDAILDKMKEKGGYENLTREEKEILYRFSTQMEDDSSQ